MKTQGKIIIGIITAIMVIAIGVGIVFAVIDLRSTWLVKGEDIDVDSFAEDGDFTLSTYYASQTGSGDTSTEVFLVFDSETGEFRYDYGTSTYVTGTFTQNGNMVEATASDTTGNESTMTFIIDGDNIFFADQIYSGEISWNEDKDKISGTFAHESTSSTYNYRFSKDGTFTVLWGTPGDHTTVSSNNGTYEIVDAQIIKQTLDDTESLPMYIYKDHFVASYYSSLTDDEYESIKAELEAAEEESESTETSDTETESEVATEVTTEAETTTEEVGTEE